MDTVAAWPPPAKLVRAGAPRRRPRSLPAAGPAAKTAQAVYLGLVSKRLGPAGHGVRRTVVVGR